MCVLVSLDQHEDRRFRLCSYPYLMIHINFCIVLIKRVNHHYIQLFGSSEKFKFNQEILPQFNSNDEEENEYHRHIHQQLNKHKQEAFKHWNEFQKLWKLLDDEAKNTELSNISKQQSLLQSIFDS